MVDDFSSKQPDSTAPLIGHHIEALRAAPEWYSGRPIINALVQFGQLAVRPLGAMLLSSTEPPLVRFFAATALSEIANPAALDFLSQVAQDDDKGIREIVLRAFFRAPAPWMLPLLLKALEDSSVSIRCSTCEVLGKMRDRRAVDPLLASLNDNSYSGVQAAAKALGQIADPRSLPALIALLKQAQWNFSSGWRTVFKPFGSAAFEFLLPILADPNEHAVKGAIAALGAIGDPRAIEPLLESCDTQPPDAELSMDVPYALRHFGSIAFDPLIGALSDSRSLIRAGAAASLGKLGDRQAINAVAKLLKDSDAVVRNYAARTLGELGAVDEIVLLVVQATTDVSPDARFAALVALTKLAVPQTRGTIIACLQDVDADVRRLAARALAEEPLRHAASLPFLVAALSDNDVNVRQSVVEALGDFRDSSVVDALIATLSDPDTEVVINAINALRQIGDPHALPAIEEVRRTGSPELIWSGHTIPHSAERAIAHLRNCEKPA